MRLLLFIVLFSTAAFAQQQQQHIDVYFDSGDANVSESWPEQLEPVFDNAVIQVTGLHIVGFCDDIGSTDDNMALSQKRAQNMADYLNTHYALTATSVRGQGEIPLQRNADVAAQRAQNRKVTVTIDYIQRVAETDITVKASSIVKQGYKVLGDTLVAGDKIIIPDLQFKGSSTEFENPEEATATLAAIVKYMKDNPTIAFEVHGHVCCISMAFSDARDLNTGFNNLSEARARKVYDHFISEGIAKERMTHKGFGRKFPRPDSPESGNKRVEIEITKI